MDTTHKYLEHMLSYTTLPYLQDIESISIIEIPQTLTHSITMSGNNETPSLIGGHAQYVKGAAEVIAAHTPNPITSF